MSREPETDGTQYPGKELQERRVKSDGSTCQRLVCPVHKGAK